MAKTRYAAKCRPERNFTYRLWDIGVDHFPFCLELMDPEWFARICPGKAAGVASAQDSKIAKGEKVFVDQKCSLCVDPTAMRTKTKAERNPPMPAKFASLPKDDLDALVAYLSSLKKK
jgi:hypothetical protein